MDDYGKDPIGCPGSRMAPNRHPEPFPQAVGDIGRFVTGLGSRSRNYGPGDAIVQDLQGSPGIERQRQRVIDELRRLKTGQKPCLNQFRPYRFCWSLLGAGRAKSAADLLDIALLDANANTAAIGSYCGYFMIQSIDSRDGTATVGFSVENDMGLSSASRSPTTGDALFGNNPFGSHGPLSTVHETFNWTERISY
jgi:hypothetical protein